MTQPQKLGAALIFFCFWLDRFTKEFGLLFFADKPRMRISLTPFLDIVMVWNPGASYGIFSSQGMGARIGLSVFAAIAIVWLSAYVVQSYARWQAAGFGLVIAGAAGNLYDRIVYGQVADFFYFHPGDVSAFFDIFLFNFIFNVADIWIFCGAVVLILFYIYESIAMRRAGGEETAKEKDL